MKYDAVLEIFQSETDMSQSIRDPEALTNKYGSVTSRRPVLGIANAARDDIL
jgi:hypothetical protein